MKPTTCIFLCITIFVIRTATATNLNSAEEGRCLAWMVRRVAGVDIPNLPTPSNNGPHKQGKRGPIGMKGEPGVPGPPGTCQCDMDEITSLRRNNEELTDRIGELQTEMADVKARLLVIESHAEATTPSTEGVSIQCGTSVRHNAGFFTKDVTALQCPSGCSASGSVWGTSIYTDDSSICKAAIHDGKITNGGGLVILKKMPGRSSYTASTAYGITTASYGSWNGSYKFCSGIGCQS